MPWMYMLQCSDGSFCVGSTANLDARLAEHNMGRGSAYTAARLPVRLVYAEEFDSISAAFAREKQVQGWSRRKRLALIEGRYDDLPLLSRKAKGGGSPTNR